MYRGGSSENDAILSIDLGTSGPKVGLVSSRGEIIDCECKAEPTPVLLLPGGGAEQDPEVWWGAVVRSVRRLLSRGAVSPDQVRAISVTTQWSGTVAVDREGHALMNAIIWMDARGAPYIRQLFKGLVEVGGYDPLRLMYWIDRTGGVPGQAGKDPIAHILYIQKCHPDIYRQTDKFLEPKDYLNLRLTGKVAASYDSICLHWLTDNRRIEQVVYDPRLLALTGIGREKLPDLKRSVDLLGTLTPVAADELGLPDQVQVVVGSPDVQTAAIGSGAVDDYQAHLYLGTSSWLACHVPFKKTNLLCNMASLPSANPERYLVTNEQECAGACLNWLIATVLYPQDVLSDTPPPSDAHVRLNALAQTAAPGSDGLIFTPWLYGERTPVDDRNVRSGFFNQSLETTRAQMARAVFEGVAYNSRWLLDHVERFIRRPFGAIHLVGGGAVSDLWCQIHADVLDRPVRQVEDPIQVNVRGAAFLALAALGRLGFQQMSGKVRVMREFRPDPANRKVYDGLFREFVNLYYRNRPIYARLNGTGR